MVFENILIDPQRNNLCSFMINISMAIRIKISFHHETQSLTNDELVKSNKKDTKNSKTAFFVLINNCSLNNDSRGYHKHISNWKLCLLSCSKF